MKKNPFEAIPAIKELDDGDAASYSGGVAFTGSNDPDVILYRDGGFAGGNPLAVNASLNDGIRNVGNNFNDITSSFVIIRGVWRFYRDADFQVLQNTIGPGLYSTLPGGIANDSITSLRRVG
jgi:hypothetical protein